MDPSIDPLKYDIEEYESQHRGFFRERLVSRLGWSCLIVQILAVLCTVVWFFGPGWVWSWENRRDDSSGDNYYRYGLWHVCWHNVNNQQRHICVLTTEMQMPGWWSASQALAGAIFLLAIISLIILCVYICRKRSNRKVAVICSIIPLNILAGVSNVALFSIFNLKFQHYTQSESARGVSFYSYTYHYAFGLSVLSAVFYLIVAFLAYLEASRLRR